jgi:hypothetical protein
MGRAVPESSTSRYRETARQQPVFRSIGEEGSHYFEIDIVVKANHLERIY